MDMDMASSSYSRTIGQEDCIQKGNQLCDDPNLTTKVASDAANENRSSGSLPKGPESFSNWKENSVKRQSASATMIEFLPLPVTSNLELFSTGI